MRSSFGKPPPTGASDPSSTYLRSSQVSYNSAAGEGGGGGIAEEENTGAYSITLALTDSSVDRNTASYGGGLYVSSYPTRTAVTTLNLDNTTVDSNSAVLSGGGLDLYGDLHLLANVLDSEFSNNAAQYGAGMANSGGQLTVTAGSVHDDTASVNGGGILNAGTINTTATASSVNFYNNVPNNCVNVTGC